MTYETNVTTKTGKRDGNGQGGTKKWNKWLEGGSDG
jgi:hypothetical protein